MECHFDVFRFRRLEFLQLLQLTICPSEPKEKRTLVRSIFDEYGRPHIPSAFRDIVSLISSFVCVDKFN
jgi:hypothetical protein